MIVATAKARLLRYRARVLTRSIEATFGATRFIPSTAPGLSVPPLYDAFGNAVEHAFHPTPVIAVLFSEENPAALSPLSRAHSTRPNQTSRLCNPCERDPLSQAPSTDLLRTSKNPCAMNASLNPWSPRFALACAWSYFFRRTTGRNGPLSRGDDVRFHWSASASSFWK